MNSTHELEYWKIISFCGCLIFIVFVVLTYPQICILHEQDKLNYKQFFNHEIEVPINDDNFSLNHIETLTSQILVIHQAPCAVDSFLEESNNLSG